MVISPPETEAPFPLPEIVAEEPFNVMEKIFKDSALEEAFEGAVQVKPCNTQDSKTKPKVFRIFSSFQTPKPIEVAEPLWKVGWRLPLKV